MKVRELMTEKVSVVTPDDSLTRAAEIMRDESVGLVPVVDDRSSMRLEGVLTDRDVAVRCVASGHDERNCKVRDHMTAKQLITVGPDMEAETVLRLMEREQFRRIPIVKDGSRLVGIVAQADVARKIGPTDPARVERLLEMISRPRNKPVEAPWKSAEVDHEIQYPAAT